MTFDRASRRCLRQDSLRDSIRPSQLSDLSLAIFPSIGQGFDPHLTIFHYPGLQLSSVPPFRQATSTAGKASCSRHTEASYNPGQWDGAEEDGVPTNLSSHFFLRALHVKQPVWTLRIFAFGFSSKMLSKSLKIFTRGREATGFLGRQGRLNRVHRSQGMPPLQPCLISAHRRHVPLGRAQNAMLITRQLWGGAFRLINVAWAVGGRRRVRRLGII